ncbi:MAG: hypothetical protein E7316_07025 [Clostridiales bacterium]|nr:hypothetical protein [Clostridiales bacterium]
MKTVRFILTLVFGILGLVYTLLGGAMLYFSQYNADPDLFILGHVFFWLGLAFLIAMLAVRYFLGRSLRRREELLTYGLRVPATVTDIRVNYNVRVNHRSPVVIYAECIHPVSREKVTLRSHNLWNCTMETGRRVDILFDQMNEKLYVFDIREEADA